MSDVPDNEEIVKYVQEIPLGVLRRLPPSDKRERAVEHITSAVKLAHEAREAAPREETSC